jgi:hypothetical protein
MAIRLVSIYTSVYPNTLTLVRQTHTQTQTKQIHWRLWRGPDHHMILASFQGSYQIHPDTHTSIGWCTGWLESATQPNSNERDAIILAMMETVPFDWIWADKAWIRPGTRMKHVWHDDGAFHWYAYQWRPIHEVSGSSYIIQA